MGKKILFAVMALLVMATGKIWAEGETAEKTAYAVLHSNGDNTYTMYFVYTSATVNTEGSGEITVEIKGGSSGSSDPNGGPDTKIINYTKAWEINPTNTWVPAWDSATEKAKITKVVFMESFKDVKVTSCYKWFSSFTMLEEIENIKYLDTSEVGNMQSMFNNCRSLKSLDLSSFNTSNVENMSDMFSSCSKLKSLDLSSFNTSNVENMNSMFFGCSSQLTLTIGSFDMTREQRVNNKDNMFGTNTYITIKGNALVFVKSEQKEIWENISGAKLMVKKDDAYKYDGNITIDYSTGNETAPLVISQYFTANSVTFKRTFAAGKPHTVCLPFAITNTAEYGTFYELSGYDNGKVKFKKINETKRNKPYLFIPYKDKDDVKEINVTGGDAGVAISSTTNGGYAYDDGNNTYFCGVYKKKTFTKAEEDEGIYYGWTEKGDFKKAGAGASVAPCRAYIKLAKETTGSSSAPARLSVEFDDGETTGIDTIGTANGGADAPMYNLQGQRVGSGYKGVVIKNGKKMIVR